MKDTFHWHTYIYCRLNKIHYWTFICQFQNFDFILSTQTDLQYCSSSFFCSQKWLLKNSFLFLPAQPIKKVNLHVPARLVPTCWKKHPSFDDPAQPVVKITSHIRARPGPVQFFSVRQEFLHQLNYCQECQVATLSIF